MLAADESRGGAPGEQARVRDGRPGGLERLVGAQQPLAQGSDARRRDGSQLVAEGDPQVVVDLQRVRRVPAGGEDLHQPSVRRRAQRLATPGADAGFLTDQAMYPPDNIKGGLTPLDAVGGTRASCIALICRDDAGAVEAGPRGV